MIQLENEEGQFELKELPIVGSFNVQRFSQWSPEETSNWYVVKDEKSKQPTALYPVMGRSHINYLGVNRLIYGAEPRGIFKTINYAYVVVGNVIYQVNSSYDNQAVLSGLQSISGPIYFTMLVVNAIVYACFVDGQKIYIYQEGTGILQVVTDPLAPGNSTVDGNLTKPGYITTFGNRLVVSIANSSQFFLSAINLAGNGASPIAPFNFDPSKVFTNFGNTPSIFALEDGIIRQMGVLNNTLYIFTDYITGVWSNIISVFSGFTQPNLRQTFPFKKNTTYSWNYGIANPTSLDIDFGRMVFLARNSDGLLQFMVSNGGQPQSITSKSVSTLLQQYTNEFGINNPFLVQNSNGFLFQYEDTIFYRMSGGDYTGTGLLDQVLQADSIEFSFESNEWHRCIELNGERSRVKNHVYFNFKHLVTLTGDNTVYDLSGQYYYNEITNPLEPNPQDSLAYTKEPIRYERSTPIIYLGGYAEFETEYVQIDFVFGDSNINFWTIDSEDTYNVYFKPHIELFWSDDGGISFHSADNREFSQMGVYSWRMRWYQLGQSRNRVYKLVCISDVPIVILGGTMSMRRSSGGAS